MHTARLVLKSGEIYSGFCTKTGEILGEVVFNTGMVGYVEAMTDPSYRGQLLVFTYPLIGNYGVPPESDWESNKVHVAGVIVSQVCAQYSHREAVESLAALCARYDVPLLSGVDTRALAKYLSHQGVMPGCITTQTELPSHFIDINEQPLVKAVSIASPIEYGEGSCKIILIDCGVKQNIIRHLLKFPVRIKQVPFDYDFTQEDYDGVCISNGPGNPSLCQETIAIIKKLLTGHKPVFGICLGAQMMALAAGAQTYKLAFGHRAQNHPCMDVKTERCYLTSQNHGFSIDEQTLPSDWQVSFRHLNDGTVQGIAHQHRPFFAVQFHPESGPGPVDTRFLFEQFFAAVQHRQI